MAVAIFFAFEIDAIICDGLIIGIGPWLSLYISCWAS